MPQREIKAVFFIDENGIDHPQGATVELSDADAKRYDEAIGQSQSSILDAQGTEGPSPEGSPDAGDTPVDPAELQSRANDEGYDALTADELEQLARSRDLYEDIEGSGSGGNVVKSDLVAALEADDS